MKKKIGIMVLAVTLVSSLMLFTSCKQHHSKGAFMLDYVTEALDLTSEQQNSLAEIRAEIVEEMEAMHEDKEEMRDTIKAQLAAETIDKEVVKQLIADHRAQMDTVIDLAVDRLSAFHSELSSEQKDKLIAKLEKFEKYHSHRFKH